MNKNFKQVITFTILMLFFAFLGTQIQKRYFDTKEVIKVYETKIDTLYKDRVKIEKEVETKIVYRDKLKEQEKLIVYDTIICNEIVDNLKKQLDNCDSVVVFKDKIITKTDSIVVFKDKIIKNKTKPFGVGAQVGYGIDGKPYIGVGVSVNLIKF